MSTGDRVSTVDELRTLTAALAAAGYPTALSPTPAGIRPCVTVLPPTIVPVAAACPGPRVLTVPVRVVGAGVTAEQVLDLVDAVDDVLIAVPAGWAITHATPDPAPDADPAYLITLTQEVT